MVFRDCRKNSKNLFVMTWIILPGLVKYEADAKEFQENTKSFEQVHKDLWIGFLN